MFASFWYFTCALAVSPTFIVHNFVDLVADVQSASKDGVRLTVEMDAQYG